MNLYVELFLIAFLGAALKAWSKFIAMRNKAIQANIAFDWRENVRLDWPSWVATLIAIAICMFLVDSVMNWKPWMIHAIRPIFVTVGWAGADLVITALGASNKYINRIIDIKTSIADKMSGTTNTPTPIPTKLPLKDAGSN